MDNDVLEQLKNLYYREDYIDETESVEKFVFAQNDRFFDILDRKPVFNVLRLLSLDYILCGNDFLIEGKLVDSINGQQPWDALSYYCKEYYIEYKDGNVETITFPLVINSYEEHVGTNINRKNYVKIQNFDYKDDLYTMLNRDRAQYLILDLRNNTGGNLNNMVCALSLFCEGELFYLRNKKQDYVVRAYDVQKKIKANKIFIIVDNNTASSAEFFTETLIRKCECITIGVQTHGKWVAQSVMNYLQKSIKVPQYAYCDITGKGRILQGGIIPDYICSQEKDIWDVIGEKTS